LEIDFTISENLAIYEPDHKGRFVKIDGRLNLILSISGVLWMFRKNI